VTGHPDDSREPFAGYPSEWAPGVDWPHTPLTWLSPMHATDASHPVPADAYAGRQAGT
jgi:hypothetical protein